MAALIAWPYLGLVAIDARCSSRWSMVGMTDATFGVPPWEKKSIASLKTCDGSMISQKKSLIHQWMYTENVPFVWLNLIVLELHLASVSDLVDCLLIVVGEVEHIIGSVPMSMDITW